MHGEAPEQQEALVQKREVQEDRRALLVGLQVQDQRGESARAAEEEVWEGLRGGQEQSQEGQEGLQEGQGKLQEEQGGLQEEQEGL